MTQDIFESLGLSPNEAKMYETLLSRGECSISEIAVAASIHRRNAYDAMQRLIDKGLCFQIFSSTENKYNAVDPGKLTELLAEKQDRLSAALPEMQKKYHATQAAEEAYIYRGLEGQKNIFRDVLRVGQDSYFIGAKGGWYDPRLEPARQAFFREANRKKIRFIQLFDHALKNNIPDFPAYFEGNLEYRFLPEKYSTNSAIHIFGDYVITYTGMGIKKLDEHVVFFVLHSQSLADSYRTWFKYMWDEALSANNKNSK